MFGHEQMQTAINAIKSLAEEVGRPRLEWTAARRGPSPDRRRGQVRAADHRGLRHRREAGPLRPYRRAQEAVRRRARRRSGHRPGRRRRSKRPSTTPKSRWCAVGSSPASRASMAAIRAPFARSAFRWACCRGHTARPCSPAARRRRSSSPRWAPGVTRRSSTRSKASGASRSCCTTTFPRIALARRDLSARRSAEKSAMAGSLAAASRPSCRIWRRSPTSFASCRRSPSRTARARWPRSAAPACP